MSAEKTFLRSGELARLTGVSSDTLRHYERKGVLPRPRRAVNGYREYPAAAFQRVQLIRRALAVGFSLDELANILRVRDSGGAPCHEVRALASSKLLQVEAQLKDLVSLRNDLRSILKDWDMRLKRKPSGGRANLLESLVAPDSNVTKSSRRFGSPLKSKTKRRRRNE